MKYTNDTKTNFSIGSINEWSNYLYYGFTADKINFRMGTGYSGQEDCYITFDKTSKKITLYVGNTLV